MYGTLFVVWTMVGSACLTLSAVHLVIWLLDRSRLASLAFCVLALATAATAACEFGLMRAASAEDYREWLRIVHVPIFFYTVSLVAFVHLHLGSARAWLGWTVIVMRAIVLFGALVPQTAGWYVTAVAHLPAFGDPAATSVGATLRPLQWFATGSSLLLSVYVVDATLSLWRHPSREARRKARVVGGAMSVFVVASMLQAQLVIWGVVQMPIMRSPAFLIMLAAITYELCREIVASARIENEARRLRDELAHVSRVGTLSELSGSLAHELNQPLAAILRNSEAAQIMLRSDSPDLAELRAIVTDIHADDQRAGAIIERMRALLKRRSVELHAVSLQPLAQEVLALVRNDAAARRVTLGCAISEGLPAVMADRVQVSQVLLNLLVNGIDAASESRRVPRHVALEARRTDARTVEVLVADSGRGIAPETLPRLFEPFVTTKAKGLGIGLAVSRTIVEAHGGRLWAHNNPDRGASFRFTLPVAAA